MKRAARKGGRDLIIGTQSGKQFTLDLELMTGTFSVLGIKGSGKTHTARKIAEEFLEAGQPIVAFDPTGAWFGLRSKYPVLVLGGDNADLPLDPKAGEYLAKAVVSRRFPVILDFAATRKGEMRRFATAFCDTLFHLNRAPIHLFIDEADMFCPQMQGRSGDIEAAKLIGAIEDLVKRGRRKGIGTTLITQRPASLNKDVLCMTQMLVCHRVSHPLDIKAVRDWVNVQADLAQAGDMIASLPTMPTGTGWFWGPSPDVGGVFAKVTVGKCRSFDSSATPKVGSKTAKPKELVKVDVEALGAEIAAMRQKADEEDPAKLRATIKRLTGELAAKNGHVETKIERVEIPVVLADDIRALRELHAQCERIAATVNESVQRAACVNKSGASFARTLKETVIKKPIPRPSPRVASGPGDASLGNSGMRRMLVAIAQHSEKGATAKKVSALSIIARSGGTWRTYLGKLRTLGYVEGDDNCLTVTDAGLKALGSFEPLPTGADLIPHWQSYLGNSGIRRIFDALVEAYPKAMSEDDLREAANIEPGGGTFRTYVGKLRTLELIERGQLKAAAELFE